MGTTRNHLITSNEHQPQLHSYPVRPERLPVIYELWPCGRTVYNEGGSPNYSGKKMVLVCYCAEDSGSSVEREGNEPAKSGVLGAADCRA